MPGPLPCILAEGVEVAIDGHRILKDLSFSVQRGERVIVAGPNGAGKTTLLKVILGLQKHNGGRLSVLGAEVGSREWARQRRRVGYVNQEAVSVDFPISGREVVAIGACALDLEKAEKKQRIEEAMAIVGCSHLQRRTYARLSGGEKQKLSLARCLCQDPELLLLDEPTSSLDPQARREVMGLLHDLNESRGLTVVMVSHDSQALAEAAWRIESMEAGTFA
ncbi:MAG TPA: ATP-binding cassette domain-containing protein [Spirochaetia bacterium]|nr:ATP-binding cassette domain-containing protein [Spirochaetia bacterium]